MQNNSISLNYSPKISAVDRPLSTPWKTALLKKSKTFLRENEFEFHNLTSRFGDLSRSLTASGDSSYLQQTEVPDDAGDDAFSGNTASPQYSSPNTQYKLICISSAALLFSHFFKQCFISVSETPLHIHIRVCVHEFVFLFFF